MIYLQMASLPPPEPAIIDLARRTLKGIGWNSLTYGFGKLLTIVTTSILAHLLSPDNFGLAAYASVAITYLTILRDMGLGAALVQRRGDVEKTASTVFTLNLMVGLLMTATTVLLAPLAALYFKEPQVTPMLRWLGLSILINSLGSIHMSRLQRELNFKWKMVPMIGSTAIKGIVSIFLGLLGYGAWALIFGQLAGSAVSLILVWVVLPWRPRIMIDRKIAGELFKYGFIVMGENALSVAQDDFDYLVVGRLFSQAAMGIYTLAYQIPEMLVLSLLWVISDVIFPAFSSIQSQAKDLKKSILITMRYMGLIITPICLGMIVAADPMVRVVFGEKWLDVIPIMRILALYALVYSIGFNIGDVYKAIGRPAIIIKITLPTMIFRILALWLGGQMGGLIGIAYGHLLAALVEVIVRLVVATRILHITFKEIFTQFTSYVGGLALLAMALPLLSVTGDLFPLVRLVILVLFGAAAYIGTMYLIERHSFADLIGLMRTKKVQPD